MLANRAGDSSTKLAAGQSGIPPAGAAMRSECRDGARSGMRATIGVGAGITADATTGGSDAAAGAECRRNRAPTVKASDAAATIRGADMR